MVLQYLPDTTDLVQQGGLQQAAAQLGSQSARKMEGFWPVEAAYAIDMFQACCLWEGLAHLGNMLSTELHSLAVSVCTSSSCACGI